MVAASGQQYDIGEKPAVILHTFTIAVQVHQNKGEKIHAEQKYNSSVAPVAQLVIS